MKNLEWGFRRVMCLSGCLTAYRRSVLVELEPVLENRSDPRRADQVRRGPLPDPPDRQGRLPDDDDARRRAAGRSCPTTLSAYFSQQLRWRRSNIVDYAGAVQPRVAPEPDHRDPLLLAVRAARSPIRSRWSARSPACWFFPALQLHIYVVVVFGLYYRWRVRKLPKEERVGALAFMPLSLLHAGHLRAAHAARAVHARLRQLGDPRPRGGDRAAAPSRSSSSSPASTCSCRPPAAEPMRIRAVDRRAQAAAPGSVDLARGLILGVGLAAMEARKTPTVLGGGPAVDHPALQGRRSRRADRDPRRSPRLPRRQHLLLLRPHAGSARSCSRRPTRRSSRPRPSSPTRKLRASQLDTEKVEIEAQLIEIERAVEADDKFLADIGTTRRCAEDARAVARPPRGRAGQARQGERARPSARRSSRASQSLGSRIKDQEEVVAPPRAVAVPQGASTARSCSRSCRTQNLKHIKIGTKLYGCSWGLVMCSRVGKVKATHRRRGAGHPSAR